VTVERRADEALAMTVLAIDEERALALCGTERGHRLSVEIAPLLPVAVGEVLLVHAGTALARAKDGEGAPG
jgi:hydrogenase maturation factor